MDKMSNSRAFGRLRNLGLKRVIVAAVALFLLISGTVIYNAYTESTWTGYGTVMIREEIPASENRAATSVHMAGGMPINSEVSTEKGYSLTVRDQKGKDHTFRATKLQYESAQVGSRFFKNE